MSPSQLHSTGGMQVLKGVPASSGIAIGQAFVLDSVQPVDVASESITPDRIAHELERFRIALEGITTELEQAMELAVQEGPTAVNIVESYQLVVADPYVQENIVKRISEGVNAESGVAREFDAHRTILYNSQDAFLRSRAQDLEFVKERIITMLRKKTISHSSEHDRVIVAAHVTPQDMLFFKATRTLGYVTEIGGINSHVCILARDMNYPAVVGVTNAADLITSNSTVIVDGYSGVVIVNPDESTLASYYEKVRQAESYRAQLGELAGVPSITTDGARVSLLANIDEPNNVDAALMAGADGVGLVRTEYLLMKLGRYPSEDEQTAWYRDIAERAFPLPVTFRAFDVGSDKFRQGIPHAEENPALGLRGIRFLLYRPDLFRHQISAILRASVHGNVKLMLPMVSMIEEITQATQILEECKTDLALRGLEYDGDIPLGIMIETPAAAMLADPFAKAVNFLSIGTNDLAQYALASDRTNDLVANIHDPLHPAVLRMIRMIVDAAKRHHKSVSVCGELAGHALATELLIGLGVSELSVAPRLLLELKRRILSVSYEQCVSLSEQLLECTSVEEVHDLLNSNHAFKRKDDFVA